MQTSILVEVLARSFSGGEQTVDAVCARGEGALGRPWRWLRPLARRYLIAFEGETRPSLAEIERFLRDDDGFARALQRYRRKLTVAHWLTQPPRMDPVPAAADWNIPRIDTAGDLADWLSLTPSELDWLADLKGLTYRRGASAMLQHYRCRELQKGSGGIRLIEAPKPRMKDVQRRILSGILTPIPPHPAAHGFRQGRSIRSFAAPHAGQRVVLRMDLHDFFPSISLSRVAAFFRTAGYPDAVATLLAGVCSSWHPLFPRRHLPQGAPTSPAIANLCAYRFDCRLNGLAHASGAEYTRYADDLAFSGGREFERSIDRFAAQAAVLLSEEGFAVQHRKTRVMRQGVRQYLAGLTANAHPNIVRADYDRLKAMLTNCVHKGPASQNREGHANFREHLAGRIAFVHMINPARAQKLRAIFARINWP
jgi:hypothetical protein